MSFERPNLPKESVPPKDWDSFQQRQEAMQQEATQKEGRGFRLNVNLTPQNEGATTMKEVVGKEAIEKLPKDELSELNERINRLFDQFLETKGKKSRFGMSFNEVQELIKEFKQTPEIIALPQSIRDRIGLPSAKDSLGL